VRACEETSATLSRRHTASRRTDTRNHNADRRRNDSKYCHEVPHAPTDGPFVSAKSYIRVGPPGWQRFEHVVDCATLATLRRVRCVVTPPS